MSTDTAPAQTPPATAPVQTPPAAAPALRPRAESANIRTWIGFKQFMALAQEAVLDWFRARGLGPQTLFHEHGCCLRVVDSSVLLPAVLEVDDEVTAEVTPAGTGRFAVRLAVWRDGATVRVLRGTVTVALHPSGPASSVPPELASLVTDAVPRPEAPPEPADPAGFAWEWRIRYFHCQYSELVAHSTWVQAMEEVVDRFLEHRGVSVPRLLAERGWIPVVSRARVTMLGEARMDDRVRVTFTVPGIVGGRAFDGRMDVHVLDDDGPRHVATGTVLHGYAISRGPEAGRLAELDAPTVEALTGGRP